MAETAAARAARFARRAEMNNESLMAFLGAILALMTVAVLLHWVRRAGHRLGTKKPATLVAISRRVRNISNRKVPGLPSAGHSLVVFLYVAINVIITFTNLEYSNPLSNLGSRTGLMAVSNMVVVFFLALKNTPLAAMTPWSYERLNVLHQISGYTTVAFVILHAATYSSYFVNDGRSTRLLARDEIYGMVAGVSFLMLGFVGAVVRRWSYEIFYSLHVAFVILGIVMTGLHQPELSKKVFIATSIAGGIWGADRVIRFCRLAIYSTNNSATLTPLPNGGTRVTLAKAPVNADSGKHCFLWIPAIRACETHPFTIAGLHPMEFVVKSHDGFTSALHKYAVKHPGATLKASVEGAYGTFPDPLEFDKVVLMAGGSGASFTFGVLQSMLRRSKPEDMRAITLVWVVRNQSYLHWYLRDLEALLQDRRVNVQIYVTRGSTSDSSSSTTTSKSSITYPANEVRPQDLIEKQHTPADMESSASNSTVDLEKSLSSETESRSVVKSSDSSLDSIASMSIRYQRPDVESIIRGAIDSTEAQKRVAILGCGPNGMINQAGAVAAFTVDVLVYPLDTLKTRYQSQDYLKVYASGSANKPFALRGLYQGIGSVVLATLPAAGVFFSTYESTKKLFSRTLPIPEPLVHSSASAVAEMASCLILAPAEVIKQNAQMLREEPGSKHIQGSSSLRAFRQLAGDGARQRLFSGYTALVARNLPFTALQFPAFEYVRSRLSASNRAADGRPSSLLQVWMNSGISAGSAGAFAAVATTPSDVVKTRMMLTAGNNEHGHGSSPAVARKGAWAVTQDVWRERGFKGFFRGGLFRSAWTALASGLYLGTYDVAKVWLERRKDRKRQEG
ncbi:S-adenosylmethionine mitochondrial carrier protein [Paramyrothecium foliicola]|nr:S-adenosylmethionine mitochondrial carrier protein [Paramyrothecium foliicola]